MKLIILAIGAFLGTLTAMLLVIKRPAPEPYMTRDGIAGFTEAGW